MNKWRVIMAPMIVRRAILEDSVVLSDVLRASILELCRLDHKDDPVILGAWLENKTPENVVRWLSNPTAHLLVAEREEVILGVGCVTQEGEVVLNYVSPDCRLQGVSSRILETLEAQAWQDGNARVCLDSTATAYRFYLSRGYEDAGASAEKFGLKTFPMHKLISSPLAA